MAVPGGDRVYLWFRNDESGVLALSVVSPAGGGRIKWTRK